MQQFAFQKGMESDTGYECQTTFFDDLTIAEMCWWEKAIINTYKRVMRNWKDDLHFITEFIMMLNWKARATENNPTWSRCYSKLWEEAHDRALSNLKWEDLNYYLRTTD